MQTVSMSWQSLLKGCYHQRPGSEENRRYGKDPYRDLPGYRSQVDFFQELPEYDVAMYTHKKMKTNSENSLEVLNDVLPILEAQEDFTNDALYAALSAYVSEKGYKTGFVMWPIRTAVSGKQMTPAGATEIMEVLGKEESLARIRKGIEMLSAVNA